MTGLITEFLPALRDPAHPVPAGLHDGAGRPAGRRFNVYRNNVLVSLIEALETGFPAIRSLLGAQNFRNIARGYATENPPEGPLMIRYGQHFPDWVAAIVALAHIPYLPDVARLELALRASYHAADHTALTAEDLSAVSQDDVERTPLALAPSVHLMRSAWPVVEIRRFALDPSTAKPKGGAQEVAVIRPDFDPVAHALPAGGFAFMAALRDGQPLGQAADTATDAAPQFDLGEVLAFLLSHRALTKGTPRQ
ncbi:putative DNA-binding domain-containing protein [Lutimaribacter sp. EGI FJ00015]|uniref:DNA-binding domain-containing protein n=1 Tax=Lutimaribacter degradans TaxID=2945989 RepID=A0ACC5ZQI1_9RHOB|nr:DNA-binding domain-containing protein [Lutimaribacter sp. EGI FJ00013]MCM2560558.1 putative DNA-binding domain-containing protein [Lutimaribacter sp. EGI FJ00013]MCO0612499.1 putative DNA-binding domain-containing protein [Lutimaribacter sp. EGI FJ00015]MCO0634382.1 putative DNA-binding domain-containing protein [Lutimaribacter sp. EGI FJ00014]